MSQTEVASRLVLNTNLVNIGATEVVKNEVVTIIDVTPSIYKKFTHFSGIG